MFSMLSPKYTFVPDSHLQSNAAALLEREDVVFFFSYSGSTRDFRDVWEIAKDSGVRVILVTRFPNSPGGRLADVVLQCGANEIPLQAGSAPARVSQLFVLDVLFRMLCQRDPDKAAGSLERIADSLTRKHL